MDKPEQNQHVVIVGGGFGGLFAARALGKSGFRVTLLDKRNFHLFQPLLYQVATGSLVVGDIATPQRVVLRRQKNIRCITGTAYEHDPENRLIKHENGELHYDILIAATGVKHHYFGNDHWRDFAPGLKTVEHALEMRRKIFNAFELAEQTDDAERRQALMTFVVVGGGPTGVELAGALGELANKTMRGDFRHIKPTEARIILIEGADEILPAYPEKLGRSARRMLEELGVTVHVQSMVEDIKPGRVVMRKNDEVQEFATETVLWAAGVRASAFGEVLASSTGAQLDRGGKVHVNPDLSLPGYENIFVIGDLAHCEQPDGSVVPGLAPAAIQQGRYVAKLLKNRSKGRDTKPFRYVNKGTMAVIGSNRAIADIGKLHFSGFFAWWLWIMVHIMSLLDTEQRISVMTQWIWKYLTRRSGSRLVTGDPPRTAELRARDNSA